MNPANPSKCWEFGNLGQWGIFRIKIWGRVDVIRRGHDFFHPVLWRVMTFSVGFTAGSWLFSTGFCKDFFWRLENQSARPRILTNIGHSLTTYHLYCFVVWKCHLIGYLPSVLFCRMEESSDWCNDRAGWDSWCTPHGHMKSVSFLRWIVFRPVCCRIVAVGRCSRSLPLSYRLLHWWTL